MSEISVTPATEATSYAAHHVRRLFGHLRIAAAGVALAVKLGVLFFLLQAWSDMGSVINAVGLWRVFDALGPLMLVSIFVARLLSADARPVLVSALAFGICTSWMMVNIYLLGPFERYASQPQKMSFEDARLLVPVLVAGAAIGHLLFNKISAAVRRLERAPDVKRLLPTFGHSPAGDYRVELNDALQRVLRAYTALIRAGRMLVIVGIAVALVALSFAWAEDNLALRAAPMRVWLRQETVLWLALSVAVSAILGLALLPAGKLRSCIAISLGIFVCMAVGSGIALVPVASPTADGLLEVLLVMLASAVIAVPVCAATQFIAGFVIARILPAPLRRPLLGARGDDDDGAETPEAYRAALCCEECGYSLEGLPANRCSGCTVEELRCPECGHQQPAATLHARAIQRAHKLHTVFRIFARIAIVAAVLLLLFPWLALGLNTSPRGLFGSQMKWSELVGLNITLMLYMSPLRLLLLRWRPVLLASAIVAVLPLATFAVGVGFSDYPLLAVSDGVGLLLPGWVLGAFAAPLLWRGWLMLLYGAAGTETYRWHTHKTYQHSSAGVVAADPDGVAGRELPLTCGVCHADWGGIGTAACSVCGVNAGVCPSCAAPTPISAVRIAFENMVYRARQMSLAVLAGVSLLVMGILGLVLVIRAFTALVDRRYDPTAADFLPVVSVVVISLIWGSAMRMALIRRGHLFAILAAVTGHITLFFLIPLVTDGDAALVLGDSLYLLTVLAGAASAALGAIFAAPLLHLLAKALLPRPSATALMAFLRGRSLDEAATALDVSPL